MGSGALQITISLFAILGAAGLALVCDYLRHRNEQLKAAMAAMRTPPVDFVPTSRPVPLPVKPRTKTSYAAAREVEPELSGAETVAETETEPAPTFAPIETPSRRPRRRRPVEAEEGELVRRKASRTESEMETERSAFIERAMSVAAEIASQEGRPSQIVAPEPVVEEGVALQEPLAKPEPKSDVVPMMQQMSTDGAMKDWLSRRATARMTLQTVEPEKVIETVPPQEPGAPNVTPANAPAAQEVPASVPAAEVAAEKKPETPPHVDHKLWSSLFQDEPTLVLVNRKEHTLEVVPNSGSRPSSAVVPTGVQDGTMLSRLLGSNQPYTGLVICISVKDMEERVINNTVTSFLAELSRPGDMLCRSSKDEFVLLCPDQRGSDSRRRLGTISQQLWDYQLRNLSNNSVLFSWGSEEAWRAQLSDALDAARESIALTRRTRGQQTELAATPGRRKAV